MSKAKEYLALYVGLKAEVDNLWDQIARARNNELIPAMRESVGSRTPSVNGDQLGAKVIRRIGVEERLLPLIAQKEQIMHDMETAVDQLAHPLHRLVLRARYIDCPACRLTIWREVSLKVYHNDDESHIQSTKRLHGRALQRIAPILESCRDYQIFLSEQEKGHP